MTKGTVTMNAEAETVLDHVAQAIIANLEFQTRSPGGSTTAVASNTGTVTGRHWSMVLGHELWALHEIDAVYVDDTASGTPSVYCVVREHEDASYEDLMAAEQSIRKALPGMEFDFRVRAHQGRVPSCAVPPSAKPLFVRG